MEATAFELNLKGWIKFRQAELGFQKTVLDKAQQWVSMEYIGETTKDFGDYGEEQLETKVVLQEPYILP